MTMPEEAGRNGASPVDETRAGVRGDGLEPVDVAGTLADSAEGEDPNVPATSGSPAGPVGGGGPQGRGDQDCADLPERLDVPAAGADADDQEEDDETAQPLDDEQLRSALEAMLLVVDAPAPVELLAAAVGDSQARVERVLLNMSAEWTARDSGIDLRYVGDGWRLYTRTRYAPYVERMLLDGARSKLTRAALETLAVIAYRQPVTRARVSAVRGVNVDGVIRTLVARGLIAEAGTDVDTNGTLYVTTELFLERIGLASLAELPSLAPLLPGVDLIDEINDSLETDPRYTKLKKPAESDIDVGAEN